MPYFKKPGVQILGRPRGIGAEIVVEDSVAIAACAVVDTTMRGSGSGGGGCVYNGPGVIDSADGQRGLAGGLVSNAVRRITAAIANYVRGNRGSGGGRTAISGPSGAATAGSASQTSTFLDITVSGVAGGNAAYWTNWDEAYGWVDRAPAVVTNPDGSEAGRGGWGGNGAMAQSGLTGQYGKLFLKVLGF